MEHGSVSSERHRGADGAHAPSFVRALIFNVAGLAAVLGLVLLLAMAWRAVASTREAARQEIGETLDRTAERLSVLIRTAEMTAGSAGRIARSPEVTGATLRPAMEKSLAAFEQRPALSYVGIALPATGEYGNLERTASGDVLLWLFPGTRADDPFVRNFLLTDNGFVLHQQYPSDGYDPRPRPFYQAALREPAGGGWIPAYPWIVHTGDRAPLWGFSFVQALRGGDGRLIAVLDTDFDMPALNGFLKSLAEEYRADLRIIELGPTPHLIGASQVNRTPLPVPADLSPLLAHARDGFVGRLRIEGQRRWVAARRIELKGGVSWLVVASRASPLIAAPLRRQLYQVAGLGMAATVGLLLFLAQMARRFGRPLAELEQRVAGIGLHGPEALAPAAVSSRGFRETRLLDEALSRMAVAVRQRERELSVQNGRLRSHLDNTPLAVIEWDARSRIVNVNASAVSLFRREAAAMIGRPVLSLVAPDDQPRAQAAFDLARSTARQKRLFAKGWTGGDEPGPDCEWYVTRLEPDGNGQAGACALVLDISQLVQAREQQAASLALKGAIFDSTNAAIVSFDPQSAVVEWNAAAERLFGRGREQVLGRPVAEAVRAADGPADWAAILATTGTGVFRFAGADGAFDAELFLVRFVQDGREIRTLVVHDVSARRSIEQRLQQERDYATAVLNSIPGTFYHFDEDLRLLRWNRNFERVTGYCADELATMHPLDFYPEENKALVAEKIAEVFERGEARVEVEFVAKSGERLHYLVTGVRFEHGGRRQLLGIGIDISERRRMEDALRDSLARFDAVARATGDAVWDLDLATHESWRNENYHVQFGGPGAEIAPAVGSWEERIHPDDRERVLARIRAAIAGDGDIWFDEYRMRRGDGSYAEVFDRGIVLRDAAGAGVRMVGAMQDVTERKRAEQAIRDSLARFDAAARATGDVIWDWDLASGAIWWSENFRLLFGYSADEIEPTMASWTERIHPDDREHVVARVREVVDGAGNLWEDEYRFRRKDGSWAFLLDRGYVLRDASGRGVRMIGAMQDITEQVRAETQLRALNDELERRVAHRTRELEAVNKELESFSYSVSHDLRAPLRGIAGFAEILVKNHADHLDDRARDYLGRVQAATHRMGELIDDLLKLSRVSRDEMRRETVDLSAIARDVLARLQQDAPERRVETAVEDGLVAEGDARLLRVVLENLLGNAWKFTARTPGARISFSADEQDGIRCFAVGDNGAGFDMRYADKLFGPFQRLHRVSEFPGTGIGLATVQRVLIRHGGRIWAQAEPGRGAIFRFVV